MPFKINSSNHFICDGWQLQSYKKFIYGPIIILEFLISKNYKSFLHLWYYTPCFDNILVYMFSVFSKVLSENITIYFSISLHCASVDNHWDRHFILSIWCYRNLSSKVSKRSWSGIKLAIARRATPSRFFAPFVPDICSVPLVRNRWIGV